jgi:transketolase
MRDIFIDGIYQRMRKNKQIFFLSADLGSPALDKLRNDFKEKFINVGIAEQDLVNIAAGLALENNTVYAYAIATFLTMRAYEQIRQNLSISSQVRPMNVNLIGIGCGLSYDVSGPSHHCLEDMGVMSILPNFVIFSPSDGYLVEKFVDYSIEVKSPKYLRFDGKPLPLIYKGTEKIDFKKGFYEIKKGKKICIVATGFMTHIALRVAKEIEGAGVVDIFILKPANENLLAKTLERYEYVVTLEEGFIKCGGLNSLVLGLVASHDLKNKIKRLGFKDKHVFETGSRDYLHKLNNLDEKSIIKAIKKWVK